MKVKRTPDYRCYKVESETNPGTWYTVHLNFNKNEKGVPYGQCDCPGHAHRIQNAIYRGDPPFTKTTQCKHVAAAARHLLLRILYDHNDP